jgi:hypothetical protein
LELVEEVEEMKCEGGSRTSPGCWEPTNTKKLATAGGRTHPRFIAEAEPYSYRVDTRQVKQREVHRLRWEGAGNANVVTELNQHIQLEERRVLKERPIPLLTEDEN